MTASAGLEVILQSVIQEKQSYTMDGYILLGGGSVMTHLLSDFAVAYEIGRIGALITAVVIFYLELFYKESALVLHLVLINSQAGFGNNTDKMKYIFLHCVTLRPVRFIVILFICKAVKFVAFLAYRSTCLLSTYP